MFDLYRGANPAAGIVYYANAAPPVESFAGLLAAAGAEIVPLDDPGDDEVWAFALRHPAFGGAKVWQPRKLPDVGEYLQFGHGLTPANGPPPRRPAERSGFWCRLPTGAFCASGSACCGSSIF